MAGAVVGHRRRGGDDARKSAQGGNAAVQPVQLDPEHALALDALLQLVGCSEGQDAAVVDDRDPIAELVRLLHVVGREENRPTRHGGFPGDDELPHRPCGGPARLIW